MQLLKQNLSGISLIVVAAMTSACSSFLNMEDDTPPPPTPREIRQLSIPRDLAGNRPERSPLTPEVLNAQRPIAPAVPVATMAPAVPSKALFLLPTLTPIPNSRMHKAEMFPHSHG